MTTATSQDTEITLGTGKMLTLFFGLVAICAVFFGLGFSLGRTSVKITAPDSGAPAYSSSSVRPSAVKPASTAGTADMTFYKAVQGKDDTSQPAPTEVAASAPEPAPPTPAAVSDPGTPLSNYFVQVAAVSKTEDAEALVDALKKKQYPAFSTNTPADKLIHVQLGPYTDIKEAEAMRAKLVSDGYNPILKK
jgi:cell division septation protein DedD